MAITEIKVVPSSHLDLFWRGTEKECLQLGNEIIRGVLDLIEGSEEFCFLIESVFFVEHYVNCYPGERERIEKWLSAGRLEIAAVYIDRLENNHGGESMIRNAVWAKRWLLEQFGYDSVTAVHSDLPGFAPQTPQIYAQCHVKNYAFGRSYEYGGLFRWTSPDGSSVVMYSFPAHYAYYKIEKAVIPHMGRIREQLGERILLSGGAGDLGEAGTFDGMMLADKLNQLNDRHPDLRFSFSLLSGALSSINQESLPVWQGECPSMWGTYGSATSVRLFQLDKEAEAALLSAEKWYSWSAMAGRPPAVELEARSSRLPHFIFGHSPFYKFHRYIEEPPKGQDAVEWLRFAWKLLMVTQDHNYAGVHAAQSEFDKLMYKRTVLDIARHILQCSLEAIAQDEGEEKDEEVQGSKIIVFNSLEWERNGFVELERQLVPDLPADAEAVAVSPDGKTSPVYFFTAGGKRMLKFWCSGIPAAGWRPYTLRTITEIDSAKDRHDIQVQTLQDAIIVKNRYVQARIGLDTGCIDFLSGGGHSRNMVIKGKALGTLLLYNDVSIDVLEKDGDRTFEECHTVQNVRIIRSNRDEAVIEVNGRIRNKPFNQTYRFEHQSGCLRMKLQMDGWNLEKTQLRWQLPFHPGSDETVYYGVPHGAERWGNLNEEAYRDFDDHVGFENWKSYREVLKWAMVMGTEAQISLASHTSSFAIHGGDMEALLFRSVPSCGDTRYYYKDADPLEWEICLRVDAPREPADAPWAQACRFGEERSHPLIAHEQCSGTRSSENTLISVENNSHAPEVLITAIHPGHGSGSFLLRLVEISGRSGCVLLRIPGIKLDRYQIKEVDLMEFQVQREVHVTGSTISFQARPFGIHTLQLCERAECDSEWGNDSSRKRQMCP